MTKSEQVTILLVEDNVAYRETIAAILKFENYEVVQAGTIPEALGVLEKYPIRLAVVDILLEGDDDSTASGLRLAQEISPKVPVIMLTALDKQPELVRQALEQGANRLPIAVSFVFKKEGSTALIAAIQRTLMHMAQADQKPEKTVKLDVDVLLDQQYRDANRIATLIMYARLFLVFAGGLVILIGVGLSFLIRLDLALVTSAAGVITSLLGGLFTKNFQAQALEHRDRCRQELTMLRTGQRLEQERETGLVGAGKSKVEG